MKYIASIFLWMIVMVAMFVFMSWLEDRITAWNLRGRFGRLGRFLSELLHILIILTTVSMFAVLDYYLSSCFKPVNDNTK